MFRARQTAMGVVVLVFSCGGPRPAADVSPEPKGPTADVAPVVITVHGQGAPESQESGESERDDAPTALVPGRDATRPPPSPSPPDRPDAELVWKVPVFRDDPVRGPADALVTIVQFSEFQCPFCKRVKPTIEAILKAHPKDVRLVWKDNAMPFHQRAKPAAILARFAFEKGGNPGFWKVHDALFENQHALEDADLRRIAGANGLAWDPIARAIEQDRAPKLEQSMDLALDVEARGVPHFFINGKRLVGAQPLDTFEERIAEALGSARALVARGVPRAKVYETILREATPSTVETSKAMPPPDATTPIHGDRTAPVVLQVFMNFESPQCKLLAPTLDVLEREFSGKLQIAFRHMSHPTNERWRLAAEAAQEVFAQKGTLAFWQYYQQLFAAQERGLERDTLEALAARNGVDMERFKKALDTLKHRAKIDADLELARNAGITSAPASSINGRVLSGPQSAQAFRKAIGLALAEKKKP